MVSISFHMSLLSRSAMLQRDLGIGGVSVCHELVLTQN